MSSTFTNPTPIFTPHALPAPRTSTVKPILYNRQTGTHILSGIAKTAVPKGPVEVLVSGLRGDEQTWEGHHHPDKAIHQYCAGNYGRWREDVGAGTKSKNGIAGGEGEEEKEGDGDGSVLSRFRVGAFGENLSTATQGPVVGGGEFIEMSEHTTCIGDIVAIGPTVLLQISEPRTPCFKLNHRFQVPWMSRRTRETLRAGWLYRVLRPGFIEEGDMVRLVERPHPEWSVARLMHYLFVERNDWEVMKEIVALEELGEAVKKTFRRRLEKRVADEERKKKAVEERDGWTAYRVVEKRKETEKIVALELEAADDIGKESADVEPGSHVRVKLGGNLVRAYSVTGGTTKRFELGVALDAESRGGSRFLHEQTQVGDILTVGRVTPSFPLAKDADRHVIIAGGIGITAFLAAVNYLQVHRMAYELHFAVAEEVPFKSHIEALGSNAKVYNKSLGQRLDIGKIISRADENTHIYCCGPQRLMDGVEAAAKEYGVPDSSVHFEQYTVTTSGDPFTVELKDRTMEVSGEQTLLEALKDVGMDIDSFCEVGNCGTCKVKVCSGRVEHRGTALSESEKMNSMLSCVSRGIGRIVLDM